MTDTSRDKLIARVKKLFALASNNPSEAEATSAALMAQRLMVEHDIEASEVEDTSTQVQKEITQEETEILLNSRRWRWNLAVVVAKAFRCETYQHGIDMRHVVFRFHGYAADAACAALTFNYLYRQGNRLATREERAFRAQHGWANGVYNSFVIGFIAGVRDELEAQSKELMIVESKEVKESYAEYVRNGQFTTMRRTLSTASFHSGSYSNGRIAGQDAVRSRRIEGASQLALDC